MNTFARAIAALALAMTIGDSAFALRLPPAGDCRAMAAQTGGDGLWRGSFSGTYEDFFDYRRPVFAQGCFATEYECRRWINETQSLVVNPGLMRCRPAYEG